MTRKNILKNSVFVLIFADKTTQSQHCVNFTKDLESSLNLFGIGFLAPYFPHASAVTIALFSYLFFTKAFPKPKPLLAIISLPLAYFISFKASIYLINNIFSYCFL